MKLLDKAWDRAEEAFDERHLTEEEFRKVYRLTKGGDPPRVAHRKAWGATLLPEDETSPHLQVLHEDMLPLRRCRLRRRRGWSPARGSKQRSMSSIL